MILKQYYLACLSHASYLIADERTRTAAVVDPQRDVDQYVEEAERLGLTIRHVLLTHFHADFVAGHIELARRTGATIHLGARARAEYDFAPVSDGASIEFGDVRIRALETPGHTPEGVSYVVYDLAKSATAPHAVLTGDTLFIGDVGRPDLMVSRGTSASDLAGMLYDSLFEKLLTLPDATLVYPAHGAGSACGKHMSSETVSTIGDQRRMNYALRAKDKAEFVALVTADQAAPPPYFANDAVLNTKTRATLDEVLAQALVPLSLERVLALQEEGAQLLDVRKADEYAKAHLAHSVNIGLDGKYASWAGSILDLDRPVVLIADPGREREAALRLGRIGIDRVAGYLEGGIAAAAAREDLVRRTRRAEPRELADRLAETDRARALVLDVRTREEWTGAHIEGSVNVPLIELPRRIGEVPADREVWVICKGGYRSSCASSLLQSHGVSSLVDVRGGMDAWHATKLPAVGA